jgi:Fuc2NAc and GlcNAc transferase
VATVIALALTLLLSALLCGLYLTLARRWRILALPGERSSHRQPTPHGGGAALITAFLLGMLFAVPGHGPWPHAYLVLAAAALILMLIGTVDDLRGLSVKYRLALYALCCLLVAAELLAPLEASALQKGVLVAVAALCLLWALNLYNFMDGIDGFAATQCFLACSAAAVLAWQGGAGAEYALLCLLLAASHLGFLFWNWPPARLFMGDAGSVPTGFLLAALALLGAVQGQLNAACWLILLAVFITDASWTLLWRIFTGQPFTRPHRLHAYQRLSRHFRSHLAVDLLLLVTHALWLVPLALAVQIRPEFRVFLVILAYLPLLLAMAKIRKLA